MTMTQKIPMKPSMTAENEKKKNGSHWQNQNPDLELFEILWGDLKQSEQSKKIPKHLPVESVEWEKL